MSLPALMPQSADGATGCRNIDSGILSSQRRLHNSAEDQHGLHARRDFVIPENMGFQVSAQAFNLFNHTNDTAIAYVQAAPARTPTLTYNRSFNTSSLLTAANNLVFYGPCQNQLPAKFTF